MAKASPCDPAPTFSSTTLLGFEIKKVDAGVVSSPSFLLPLEAVFV
jgi:hypothetical protein